MVIKKEKNIGEMEFGELFRETNFGKYFLIGIFCFIALLLIFNSFYTIQAGQRGVLLTFGKPNMEAMGEGLHFKIPMAQSVKKFEVKTQKVEVDADASSKDLQDVQTTIALNFHLKPDEVSRLYQEIGTSFQSRVIDPSIQESVKAVQARFTAEELVTKRPEVRRAIEASLEEKLSKYYIEVDGLNIINFQFSEEFDKAIESKVTAEQLKLKAERDLERIKIEKEQKITQAEAEAQSIKIQSEALQNNKDILELRWIEKWDGVMPTTYVSGEADTLISIRTQ